MSKEKSTTKKPDFKLPDCIVGTPDLTKSLRELEKVDDFLYQTNLRMPGRPVTLPKLSKSISELAEINKVSLLDEGERKKLLNFLEELSKKSPVIHISFASEPSANFSKKIILWARENIHQDVLVNFGLQPSVIVGCEVRTTNKVFDLSLRNKFQQMHEVLSKKLEEVDG